MNSIDEILTHLGEQRDDYFQSISPPIIQTSNFYFRSIEEFREKISTEKTSHVYTRGNNPTVKILRKKLAALEKGEDALVTSSGSAAVALSVMANVQQGDHIVSVRNPYSWTYKLFNEMLSRYGISTTFVDGKDINEIKNAIQKNTKILYLESPNSLLFEIQDLEYCGRLCKEKDLISIIDNSYCSPIFQNPIEYGIDIVVHSGTKYINGHSDVVCGVIVGSTDHIDRIFNSTFMTLGAVISPHDAWLIIRGLRTLPMRIERSDKTAGKLIERIHNHPKIERIIYPFHPSFPQLELAKKQMKGCGGLFTMVLKAETKEEVFRFVHSIKHIMMGVSWGGYESLMIPSIVFHDMPGRPDSQVPWNYIRFYIGLESLEYLESDILNALNQI